MADSVTKSGESSREVQQVAQIIGQVAEDTCSIKALVNEVNSGSQEQTRGIERIAQALSRMDEITQRNSASAEQGASAATELNVQARALKSVVGELQTLVG